MSVDAERDRVLAEAGVSRETAADLDRFVALALQWQAKTNLVAPSTIPHIWQRHIADSLQLLPLAPLDAKVWIDLGSGGGFPGLVLAIVLKARPDVRVHLVESNTKKAAFLREAARITNASAVIHAVRIEDYVETFGDNADVVTARALAPLHQLFGYASRLLKPNGMTLFLKGRDVDSELAEAQKIWSIDAELIPSKTDPDARIVRARHIAPHTNPLTFG